MGRSPRAELLSLQRTLHRRNQAIIQDSVTVAEPGFDAYERRYRRGVAKYRSALSPQSLLKQVLRSDIVYVGDYHTCAQSQRSFLRILRAVREAGRTPRIGLELLHKRAQKYVDAYLAGELNEACFVAKSRLKNHWVFDLWPNFKPIFEFAKKYKLPIIAIDAATRNAGLAERDAATGQLLAEQSAAHSDDILFAFIGDLHLAPAHLPKETMRACHELGIERRDLILYQNSEAIYWQLAEQGREHKVSAVRIDERSICRMHAPPIVYQQSYLNWLEHEEGEIDYVDAKLHFLNLVRRVSTFLRIPEPEDLDNVKVYTCGDLSFLDVLRRSKSFTKEQLAQIRTHVLAAESYFIPRQRMVYLANLSLNHAAEEASHYFKFLLCGAERDRPIVDAFYTNVLHEALGFFGSKLVNPKRKCMHLKDFRKLKRYCEESPELSPEHVLQYEMASLILDYVPYEKQGKALEFEEIFYPSAELFFAITHALGYMLGDRMFYAVMQRKLGRAAVKKLFLDPWPAEGDAYTRYMELINKLKGIKLPKRL